MRRFFDDELMEWSVWAVPSRGGRPQPGRLIFRCISIPGDRALQVEVPEGRGSAESIVELANVAELRGLLTGATPVN